MLDYLKKFKKSSSAVVGVAFGSEGIAASRVRPARRDELPALGVSAWLHHTTGGRGGAALEKWVDRQRLNGCPAVGVLAPGEYQVVQVEAPSVPPSEMRQAAAWRVRELIDMPLDQAVIDTYDPPESTQRAQKNVNVVVARRAAVAERIDELRAAGLEVVAIDIPELVQRNICARLADSGSGHALLALEDRGGLLTLYRDGEQYLARSLDIGHSNLAAADGSVIENLVLEVQRSFDYFESALSQPPLGWIYVYPGTAETAGLIESLQSNLSNVECLPLGLDDLVAIEQEPPHLGATLLHAVGAGLRDRESVR